MANDKQVQASIIIRAYNAKRTIARALNSALHQEFPHDAYEVIVVDDGSTDGTRDILDTYRTIANLRLYYSDHQGPYVAANKGFQEARGHFLTLLDSDDIFDAKLLMTLVPVLQKSPSIDFAYPSYYEVDQEGVRQLRAPQNRFETIPGGMFYRREQLEKEGYWREDIFFPEYDLFLKTIDRWNGQHVNKPLYHYFRRKEALTGSESRVIHGLNELHALYPTQETEIKKIRSYDL